MISSIKNGIKNMLKIYLLHIASLLSCSSLLAMDQSTEHNTLDHSQYIIVDSLDELFKTPEDNIAKGFSAMEEEQEKFLVYTENFASILNSIDISGVRINNNFENSKPSQNPEINLTNRFEVVLESRDQLAEMFTFIRDFKK